MIEKQLPLKHNHWILKKAAINVQKCFLREYSSDSAMKKFKKVIQNQ